VRATIFVGRERELWRLSGALVDAVGRRGRLFLIGGEPGSGETRLADQCARLAIETGAGVPWEAAGRATVPSLLFVIATVAETKRKTSEEISKTLLTLASGARKQRTQ
jgi:hypothetical protein